LKETSYEKGATIGVREPGHTIRFRVNRLGAMIGWLYFIAVSGTLVVVVFREDASPGTSAIMLTLLAGFLLLGPSIVVNTADLLVSDDGIARMILGRPRRSLAWSNVKVIRQSAIVNPPRWSDGPNCSVEIWRTTPSFWRPAGVFFSGNAMPQWDQLVEELNKQIKLHSIPVEIQRNNQWQRSDRLAPGIWRDFLEND